jgi:hypothetical protein
LTTVKANHAKLRRSGPVACVLLISNPLRSNWFQHPIGDAIGPLVCDAKPVKIACDAET